MIHVIYILLIVFVIASYVSSCRLYKKQCSTLRQHLEESKKDLKRMRYKHRSSTLKESNVNDLGESSLSFSRSSSRSSSSTISTDSPYSSYSSSDYSSSCSSDSGGGSSCD